MVPVAKGMLALYGVGKPNFLFFQIPSSTLTTPFLEKKRKMTDGVPEDNKSELLGAPELLSPVSDPKS